MHALAQLLVEFPPATVALEAGTHSPWISRYLTELGAKVFVANPRKLHAISRSERKCGVQDSFLILIALYQDRRSPGIIAAVLTGL
jgi:transposase